MRFFSAGRLFLAGLLLLVVAAAALWLIPSDDYIFLPDQAKAVAPLVDVQGERPPRGPGGIYLVDVLVRRANLLERLAPRIREGSTLVPESAVDPPGTSQSQRRRADLQAMARSQDIGAAVALRKLGYRVRAAPTGVLVVAVIDGAPAVGKLRSGDVIVAIDGRRVRSQNELRRRLGRVRPGKTVTLSVRNGSDLRNVSIRTAADPDDPTRAVLGIVIEQAATVKLPIRVKINAGEIGGPSAGLAFGLDVMEELGRDVDRGYKVAATGELELDGTVIPIGGVKQKTIGARQSGVEVFVVPAGENAAEARRYAGDMRVIPVRTFGQTLRRLATLPRRG
jgi:PDZ domain-containing protein